MEEQSGIEVEEQALADKKDTEELSLSDDHVGNQKGLEVIC